MTQSNSTSFPFHAQTANGQVVTGMLDAASAQQATQTLEGLQLRVIAVDPAAVPVRTKPIRGEDFLAFNQQLASLTASGLPVEHGLRLIAADMGSDRMAATVRSVAEDLDRGLPLGDALARHPGKFPALYGELVAAGIRAGNLPGVLLNLGRHMELVHRLRATLWRTLSYPLVVFTFFLMILGFLSLMVIPRFVEIFADFRTRLPVPTVIMLKLPAVFPFIAVAILVPVALFTFTWLALRSRGREQLLVDFLVLPLPLLGPILRRNLIARWCDAVRIGVEAKLDLPAALELARDAVRSPKVSADTQLLLAALTAGRKVGPVTGLKVVPATVTASIDIAAEQNNLAEALGMLSEMHQQQAEMRLAALPGMITPVYVIGIAGLLGATIVALFMPLIKLIQSVSGGM